MIKNGWYVCPYCGNKKVCRVETAIETEDSEQLKSTGIMGVYKSVDMTPTTKVFVWCKKCKKEVELKI